MTWIMLITALIGLSSVIMGAASTHIFSVLPVEDVIRLDMALRYHQLYSIVLLCLSFYSLQQEKRKFLTVIAALFMAGILIFSGSLYLSLVLQQPALTAGTPVGGFLLMAGWIGIGVFALRNLRVTA